jgi:hypothetical protein
MAFDYSDAAEQRGDTPIPADTVATVQLTIRPGGAGDGGLLKRSKDGTVEMLDCEFVIVDGSYKGRKLWENWVLNGPTSGHTKAAEITRGKLRAVLESARGIKPSDMSQEARKARTAELSDFDGMSFVIKIGIEKGRPKPDGSGDYPDRNCIVTIITPDRKDWHKVEQTPHPTSAIASDGAAAVVVPIVKPAWAS